VAPAVNSAKAPRTRRAEQAERTRRRILDAATALFTDPGYATTTIEAIATRADVAVETVYSRFRNKPNLLVAILEPAIVGTDDDVALSDLPDIAEIRACPDQRRQLELLVHLSRTILERTAQVHRILHAAASVDENAAELQRTDAQRRYQGQTDYIDMLLANGPLRAGVTRANAADTYATLASPATYAFLVEERAWTPDQFQEWLGDVLGRVLLP
jgi:TetR/AcrR family transcriptional regulator, regulator of autoinduction and epiphytic fitness